MRKIIKNLILQTVTSAFMFCRDAAVMYPNGLFKLLGRMVCAERFKIFGKVEYAGPIEEIISQHPDIKLVYVSRDNL